MSDIDDLPDPVVRNPPPEIFLTVGPIEEDCDFSALAEASWAEEQIFDADIEYVLASRLRRLEDLRRWRPMSDMADLRPNDCVLFRRCGTSSHIPSVATLFAGGWMRCEGGVGIPPAAYSMYEWTYIPGQEPADA